MNEARSELGMAKPLYIAGVRYKSIFVASIEAEISGVWIWKMLNASGGFPVLIKHQMVATERWVKGRVKRIMERKHES